MQNNATGTQNGNHSSLAAINPARRSIVLSSADQEFAEVRPIEKRRKSVWLDPPWPVVCTLDEEAVRIDCLVLGIWDSGARLRVPDASKLTQFDLLFASGPTTVMRRCKRLLVQGNVIDVEFQPKTPKYLLQQH
jgi:hypothetical protein